MTELDANTNYPFNATFDVQIARKANDPRFPPTGIEAALEVEDEMVYASGVALWIFHGTTALYDYLVQMVGVRGAYTIIIDDRLRELNATVKTILADRDLADTLMPGEHDERFFEVLVKLDAMCGRLLAMKRNGVDFTLSLRVMSVPAERK